MKVKELMSSIWIIKKLLIQCSIRGFPLSSKHMDYDHMRQYTGVGSGLLEWQDQASGSRRQYVQTISIQWWPEVCQRLCTQANTLNLLPSTLMSFPNLFKANACSLQMTPSFFNPLLPVGIVQCYKQTLITLQTGQPNGCFDSTQTWDKCKVIHRGTTNPGGWLWVHIGCSQQWTQEVNNHKPRTGPWSHNLKWPEGLGPL